MIAQASPLHTKPSVPRFVQLMTGLRLKLVVAVFLPGLLGFLTLPITTFAQAVKPSAPLAAASAPTSSKLPNTAKAPLAAKAAASPAVSRPSWSELTAMQQQALKPLAQSWNVISEGQKRKWLEISKNYPALPLADQATMHSRMNEWVTLSPQQRAEARLNFAKTKELSKQLTPDEKKAKWQSYQALSPEEKQKLAAKGTPKPAGAATAVKPVAPQKLAVVPKNAPQPPLSSANPAAPPVSENSPAGLHPSPQN